MTGKMILAALARRSRKMRGVLWGRFPALKRWAIVFRSVGAAIGCAEAERQLRPTGFWGNTALPGVLS
jgi:hypothetical protein